MEVEVKKFGGNYHHFTVPVDYTDSKKLFTCSDVHFDNPKCNRDLFFKHMDRAMKEDAMIQITGDLFCLMNGKYDPRRAKSAIRPEHNVDNYLDAVINDTADKFLPYAKNILIITKGNHETSVSKNMETDVMVRFVERLNTMAGTNIQVGEYTGYFTLQFAAGNDRKAINVGYSHGNWGGVITKGTLGVMRYAAILPGADIIFSGHTHDGWIVPQPRLVLNPNSRKVETKNQWHVKTGTYKEEFEDGKGWAVEKIAVPKYLGGCFTEFFCRKHHPVEFEHTLTH